MHKYLIQSIISSWNTKKKLNIPKISHKSSFSLSLILQQKIFSILLELQIKFSLYDDYIREFLGFIMILLIIPTIWIISHPLPTYIIISQKSLLSFLCYKCNRVWIENLNFVQSKIFCVNSKNFVEYSRNFIYNSVNFSIHCLLSSISRSYMLRDHGAIVLILCFIFFLFHYIQWILFTRFRVLCTQQYTYISM